MSAASSTKSGRLSLPLWNERYAAPLAPTTAAEMRERGWDAVDVVFVTGDAYVDHPSFAMAILHRVLEAAGFRVAILSQPDWKSCEPWRQFGRPRLFFAVSAGNMDSLINHYTANKKVRNDDAYSPGGRIGLRPDRATLVVLPARPRGVPRRAGDRRRRRGVAAAAGPLRLLERHGQAVDPARQQGRPGRLRHGRGRRSSRSPTGSPRGRRCGTCATCAAWRMRLGAKESRDVEAQRLGRARLRFAPDDSELRGSPRRQARVRRGDADHPHQHQPVQRRHAGPVPRPPGGGADAARPARSREAEMDAIYDLPYTRRPHPSYTEPIPAHEMIKDSVTIMRGCFGGCTFCSITAHQGRIIQNRSQESVLKEVEKLAADPEFKGVVATSAARPRTCTRCAARGRRSRRSASGSRASTRRSASCSAPTTAR